MLDKEQRIKEQRTTEAMRKGMMGLTGKLACIAKFLGSKIVSETPDMYSENQLEDVWDLNKQDEYDFQRIHDSDENAWSRDLGFIFDGLSRGMHLEIKYLIDERSLVVLYKGVKVYKETSGDLECYAPKPEWEEMIDKLYTVARKIGDRVRREDSVVVKKETERKVNNFIDELRLRWGV